VIVLDEQLSNRRMVEGVRVWYKGAVIAVKDLRPETIIKDDAIPQLLRRLRQPTFVTINVGDFWQRVQVDERFCVVCFDVSDMAIGQIPSLLRLLFRNPDFGAKRRRAGHVFHINVGKVVHFYTHDNPRRQTITI
jgi:hypothetical protein